MFIDGKKQVIIAGSSAQAEYRAMAHAVCELLRLKKVMTYLKIINDRPLIILCKNKPAINSANSQVQHDRTKHVDIGRHFIKEKLDNVQLSMPLVKSKH